VNLWQLFGKNSKKINRTKVLAKIFLNSGNHFIKNLVMLLPVLNQQHFRFGFSARQKYLQNHFLTFNPGLLLRHYSQKMRLSVWSLTITKLTPMIIGRKFSSSSGGGKSENFCPAQL